MEQTVIYAFLLTLFAGLSTGIGGLIGVFIKKENDTAFSLGLGFSAGVMIYVSLVEILSKSKISLAIPLGNDLAEMLSIVAFFIGIAISALVDKHIPESISQENLKKVKESGDSSKFKKMGLFVALAIAIHNFPEGLATFMAGMNNIALGLSIAIAIAIHNIPEGVAVSMPIYKATGSKLKGVAYSFLAGLAEPLGAIIGFFLLRFLFNDLTFGVLFAFVAGVMIYISFDELLPAAREYDKGHAKILGLSAGMFVMAVSLILF